MKNNTTFSDTKLALLSLLISTVSVAILMQFFVPYWETNDDIAMAMVAHGYGLAATASPNIGFSNIIWGYVVYLIPEIAGIQGYSIATYGALIIAGTALILGLHKLKLHFVTIMLILAILFLRPLLFPQFTINAGLLMVGAIVCLHFSVLTNNLSFLITGFVLGYFSFIIRSHEAALIAIVALPFFWWRNIKFSRSFFVALGLFAIALLLSRVFDHFSYQGVEWDAYNALNPIRAKFTDFSAGANSIQNNELLLRHGYTQNDIDLITNWFFVDPAIANPVALNAISNELNPNILKNNSIENGWKAIQALWNIKLLPMTAIAIFLAVLQPSRQIALSWFLFISAIVAIGILGRPGIIRIYYPVIAFLIIAPLLFGKLSQTKKVFQLLAFVVSVYFVSNSAIADSQSFQKYANNKQKGFSQFPSTTVVLWGGSFPFESLYPALGPTLKAKSYRIYGLGVFTLAPFSVPFLDELHGRGFITRLTSEEGVPIIGYKKSFDQLNIYCKEHHNGKLEELSANKFGSVKVSVQRCITN